MDYPAELLKQCAKLCHDVYDPNERDFLYDDSIEGYRIIAMEGTSKKTDWFTNLKFWFKNDDCHRGFKANAERTLTELIGAGFDLPKNRRLVVTGHSLGGASATCLADRLRDRYPDMIIVTFGSPRPGGSKLKKRLQNIKHYRFVHGNDIVPTTPPRLNGFRHTAHELYLLDEDDRPFDGVEDHNIGDYGKALDKWLEKEAKI